jgi:hypothetical protein
MMTTYRLDDQGIAVVQEVLLFSRNVQTDSEVHPASFDGYKRPFRLRTYPTMGPMMCYQNVNWSI